MVKSPGIIYRTKKDILIPAGTEVDVDPPHHADFYTERATVLIPVSKDVTAMWAMDMEEALKEGLVTASVAPAKNAGQ